MGTRDAATGEAIAKDIGKMTAKHASGPKVHHVSSFLSRTVKLHSADDMKPDADTAAQTQNEKLYSAAFHNAWIKAKKRLPEDCQAKPRSERESCKYQLDGQGYSPWLQAQVDVYQHILESNCGPDVRNPHMLGDIGQSTNRGGVHWLGELPCLTTSSRLYSYTLHRLGAL